MRYLIFQWIIAMLNWYKWTLCLDLYRYKPTEDELRGTLGEKQQILFWVWNILWLSSYLAWSLGVSNYCNSHFWWHLYAVYPNFMFVFSELNQKALKFHEHNAKMSQKIIRYVLLLASQNWIIFVWCSGN